MAWLWVQGKYWLKANYSFFRCKTWRLVFRDHLKLNRTFGSNLVVLVYQHMKRKHRLTNMTFGNCRYSRKMQSSLYRPSCKTWTGLARGLFRTLPKGPIPRPWRRTWRMSTPDGIRSTRRWDINLSTDYVEEHHRPNTAEVFGSPYFGTEQFALYFLRISTHIFLIHCHWVVSSCVLRQAQLRQVLQRLSVPSQSPQCEMWIWMYSTILSAGRGALGPAARGPVALREVPGCPGVSAQLADRHRGTRGQPKASICRI